MGEMRAPTPRSRDFSTATYEATASAVKSDAPACSPLFNLVCRQDMGTQHFVGLLTCPWINFSSFFNTSLPTMPGSGNKSNVLLQLPTRRGQERLTEGHNLCQWSPLLH